LKATAASGWQFVNWEGEVANTASAETTVYMDSDKTVSAVFEEIINEVPGTVNSNNSTVNLKGDLFYGQKLNQDLVLDNDLDISFVRVDLNIVLQDYQQNPVDDGEYLISISSDLDGNILVDQKISVSDGTASVNFNLLTEGNHRLTVTVDSV
ncbi:InlB B-repeat-containing protein, partial [Halanaerobacter jeridensis]